MPTRATRYKPCRQTGRSERAREGAVDSKALCRQEERVVVTLYTLYDIILYHIMLCYIILYYIILWFPGYPQDSVAADSPAKLTETVKASVHGSGRALVASPKL